MKNKRSQQGFSLLELLTVMAIMSLMMGLLVSTGMGARPAGSRQGAISQIMGALEEARMSAIEKNTTVYFGIADINHPDEEKQLRSYLLFREQTPQEKAASKNEDMIPLTRWEKLPQGFYFDADKLSDMTVEVPGNGLPGNPPNVRAVQFGSLGQVTGLPVEIVPQLAVTEAVYNPSGKILVRKSGAAGDFIVKIFRLTGRLQLSQNATP
ncbi:MAG: type II secretion system protein [Terrimicrobiaceae bacterium]|nr:type II secretion system GspH family protein [Terrimicrobiaceae bacterium]